MAAVYDIATGQQMPVEDPPPDAETAGMTEGERRAFWLGVAQGARDYGATDTAADWEWTAEAAQAIQAVRQSRRSRLEVAR